MNNPFILIAVQTKEEAHILRAKIGETKDVYVSYVGEALCGLNRNGHRPNLIVCKYVELTAKQSWWTIEVLRPAAADNAVWVDN